MNSIRKQCLAATAGAVAIASWSSPALAQEATAPENTVTPLRRSASYIDLTGSVGYSTNPFFQLGNSNGSAYGRLSARGVHQRSSERGFSRIAAFVEGSTYLDEYGLESIFSIDGEAQREVSERVTVFGSASFSGDLAGQLSNRFLYVPPIPEVPDPTIPPPPPTVEDPNLFSFTGRQYRIHGQAGVAIRMSERGSLSVSGGAQRLFYTADFLDDYTTYFANGSYSHSLSERTTVGFNVGVNRTEYDDSSDSSTIINPALTVRTLLSENWDASASVGVSFSDSEREFGSDDSSINLSLDGSVCRSLETERLCGRVSRYARSDSSAALVTTTSAGVDWFKKLDEDQTVQLAASIIHYVSDTQLVENFDTNYFLLTGSYSRRVGRRFSAGVDASVRSLRQDGPDPDTDVGGSLFLRYRLGDLG